MIILTHSTLGTNAASSTRSSPRLRFCRFFLGCCTRVVPITCPRLTASSASLRCSQMLANADQAGCLPTTSRAALASSALTSSSTNFRLKTCARQHVVPRHAIVSGGDSSRHAWGTVSPKTEGGRECPSLCSQRRQELQGCPSCDLGTLPFAPATSRAASIGTRYM